MTISILLAIILDLHVSLKELLLLNEHLLHLLQTLVVPPHLRDLVLLVLYRLLYLLLHLLQRLLVLLDHVDLEQVVLLQVNQVLQEGFAIWEVDGHVRILIGSEEYRFLRLLMLFNTIMLQEMIFIFIEIASKTTFFI